MYKDKKILVFIGARAGSKGLKDKNIIDFAGKPMIHWVIEAAKGSGHTDRIIVSTDGLNIANIAKTAGADVPFMRPGKLASDEIPVIDAIRHCISWIEVNEKKFYDYVLHLQPTSPLNTKENIDKAIEFYFNKKKTVEDTLVSVFEVPKKMAWIMEESEGGYIDFCFKDMVRNKRRQDLPSFYLPNGALYLASVDVVKKETFYNQKTIPYIMEEDFSIDIDTIEDLEKAEKYIKNYNSTHEKDYM